MINRSLIRLKAVQILYSYLLTRKDFKLVSAPDPANSTRDRQFGYRVYLHLITLVLKLSGEWSDPGLHFVADGYLKSNRVGRALLADPAVADLRVSKRVRLDIFNPILTTLTESITSSAVYADYCKLRRPDMEDMVKFWNTVLRTIIARSTAVEDILRTLPEYSNAGFEIGVEMLVNTLNSFESARMGYIDATSSLKKALDQAYSLYLGLMQLPVRLVDVRMERIEAAKNKYLPTPDDLNPNMRLVESPLVARIIESVPADQYTKDYPLADPTNWNDYHNMIDGLMDRLMESELYAAYLAEPEVTPEKDAAFWREVFRQIILPSDELARALEETSVYWNDDLAVMSTFALKTLRRLAVEPAGTVEILPKFMNRDDAEFGARLFELVVKNADQYREYIDRCIDPKNWDSERLAFMDIVILETAIAELLNFPSIPVPVTMNEYIEIANSYSTPKSGQFINGILYSVMKNLTAEGLLNKNFETK